jgi:outer membrane protein OmpA-like peptidoglycan-associated protein
LAGGVQAGVKKAENTTMVSKKLWLGVTAVVCLVLRGQPLYGDEFAFKHRVGDKFRIISEVNEEYLQNGKLVNNSTIHNRISTEVLNINNDKALHKALFQVMVNKKAIDGGQSLTVTNEYPSLFERDGQGKMLVNKRYAFPSVRNVPSFPHRNLSVGESWIEDGEEVHDLQNNFGLTDLLRIPVKAYYTYLGERVWRGKKHPAFSVKYTINQRFTDYFEKAPRTYLSRPNQPSQKKNDAQNKTPTEIVITQSQGETNQTVYWDAVLGQAAASSGVFMLRFIMSDGTVHEFRSKEEAEIIYAKEMDKDEVFTNIEKDLRDSGIDGATVKKVDDGISISMENIQFEGDSAVLRKSEKAKLDKITGILAKYAERDILVAGHTADAGGSEESHRKLSEDRALAVAGYLAAKRVRPRERIITKGYGAAQPVAENSTQEGREKNRRVEIIILEN